MYTHRFYQQRVKQNISTAWLILNVIPAVKLTQLIGAVVFGDTDAGVIPR